MGHISAKPKDPVTKEQRTDAIYSIPCNDCDNEYIGQTKRQFGTRLKSAKKRFFFAKRKIQLYRRIHAEPTIQLGGVVHIMLTIFTIMLILYAQKILLFCSKSSTIMLRIFSPITHFFT